MSSLALIATFEIAPGQRDELLPVLMAHRARCLKEEPGILQFEVLAPEGNDKKVLTYEVYRVAAALDAHRKGASLARWREDSAGMLGQASVRRYAVVE
jgi:quinol monooxygenase YgiN